MLLFVSGPRRAGEDVARDLYRRLASGWNGVSETRRHPRTAAPLQPAITRLDLFLAAFSPAPSIGESGLAVAIPPEDAWWQWVPALRPALQQLIVQTFPSGPRLQAPYDPCGPAMARPTPEGTAPLVTMVDDLRAAADPAQRPTDPRLWLVLAPPLPATLETIFLSVFLRVEAFARVARAEATADAACAMGSASPGPRIAHGTIVTRLEVAGSEPACNRPQCGINVH